MQSSGRMPPLLPRKNLLFKLRPLLRWILKLRGSKRAIAGGLGLGTFIAFTPTMGIQVIIALFLATLINVNRPAAILPVWITNPVTMAPLYTFNYWLGCFFWEGPPVRKVSKILLDITKQMASLDFLELPTHFSTFMHLGKEIIIPLVIGSMLMGTVCGLIAYGLSFQLLTYFNERRAKRKKRKQEK